MFFLMLKKADEKIYYRYGKMYKHQDGAIQLYAHIVKHNMGAAYILDDRRNVVYPEINQLT